MIRKCCLMLMFCLLASFSSFLTASSIAQRDVLDKFNDLTGVTYSKSENVVVLHSDAPYGLSIEHIIDIKQKLAPFAINYSTYQSCLDLYKVSILANQDDVDISQITINRRHTYSLKGKLKLYFGQSGNFSFCMPSNETFLELEINNGDTKYTHKVAKGL